MKKYISILALTGMLMANVPVQAYTPSIAETIHHSINLLVAIYFANETHKELQKQGWHFRRDLQPLPLSLACGTYASVFTAATIVATYPLHHDDHGRLIKNGILANLVKPIVSVLPASLAGYMWGTVYSVTKINEIRRGALNAYQQQIQNLLSQSATLIQKDHIGKGKGTK